MKPWSKKILVTLLLANNTIVLATGEGSLRVLPELKNAQIEDKAGVILPKDILLTNQEGQDLKLGSYFTGESKQPFILNLLYFECPMLCSLVLNSMTKSLAQINYKLGEDFRIISVSIDHREDYKLAKKKQEAYLASMGVTDPSAWSFHVASQSEIKRLADSIGFNYYYDKKLDQYAHGAGLFFVSPDGVLTRVFIGLENKPGDIKLALSEAADGKIGSFLDQIILSCFHYNPDSHRYGVYIYGVMRLGGVLTIIILGGFLLVLFRQERRRLIS